MQVGTRYRLSRRWELEGSRFLIIFGTLVLVMTCGKNV